LLLNAQTAAPAIAKILGEHTDFADGLVLSTSLSFEVRIALSFRKDNSLRFHAADFNERKRANIATFKYKREDRWANHVKSICDYFWHTFSIEPRGLNVTIQSTVPLGLGLGISSAINMATALAFKTLYNLDLKQDELAFHAWKAQTSFLKRMANHQLSRADGACWQKFFYNRFAYKEEEGSAILARNLGDGAH